MDTEKIATQPKAPAGPRAYPGTIASVTVDRREGSRASYDPDKATTSVRRPTESHWEWIIDRATD